MQEGNNQSSNKGNSLIQATSSPTGDRQTVTQNSVQAKISVSLSSESAPTKTLPSTQNHSTDTQIIIDDDDDDEVEVIKPVPQVKHSKKPSVGPKTKITETPVHKPPSPRLEPQNVFPVGM